MNRTPQQQAPRRRSTSDPLSVALQPPPNESQLERENRLKAEQEAKKRSDNIDKMLRESDRRSRRRKTIRVLLLGQSESGKSTTLKRKYAHPRICVVLFLLSSFPRFWYAVVRQTMFRYLLQFAVRRCLISRCGLLFRFIRHMSRLQRRWEG